MLPSLGTSKQSCCRPAVRKLIGIAPHGSLSERLQRQNRLK
jgi:hypothetical protein